MMHRGSSHRSRLDFAVRGKHLLDRAKRPAAKLARHRVSTVEIGIDHARQSDRFSLLLELLVDSGVIASEDAHTHHCDGDLFRQKNILAWPVASRNNKL